MVEEGKAQATLSIVLIVLPLTESEMLTASRRYLPSWCKKKE